MSFPPSHVINPKGPSHTHTIILLHGRNASGEEFAEELFGGTTISGQTFASSSAFDGCKWVFPNACSTYSEQFKEDISEWFDLASTSDPYQEPERQISGLRDSMPYIEGLIMEELEHVHRSHLILGGMSQGFATALHTLLWMDIPFGGFLGLSGWAPYCEPMVHHSAEAASDIYRRRATVAGHIDILSGPKSSRATTGTPMLLTHSRDDEIIDIKFGRDAFQFLAKSGASLCSKEYNTGGHEIQELDGYTDIEAFLMSALALKDK